VYRVNGIDLASRLSFFLWSSVPDEELLSLGISGKLSSPQILKQQVERLMDDPRSNALITTLRVSGSKSGISPRLNRPGSIRQLR
jgi:hypothetical protein